MSFIGTVAQQFIVTKINCLLHPQKRNAARYFITLSIDFCGYFSIFQQDF